MLFLMLFIKICSFFFVANVAANFEGKCYLLNSVANLIYFVAFVAQCYLLKLW